MKARNKLFVGVSSLVLVGAAPGTFEVVKQSSTSWLGMIAFLTVVTALTFIVVLLACGMREPLL